MSNHTKDSAAYDQWTMGLPEVCATHQKGNRLRTIRVFVLGDIRLYREGLAELLGRERHIEIVGTAAKITEAVHQMHELRPDVALSHATMADGVSAAHALAAADTGAKIIALAVPESDSNVVSYAEAGVSGYIGPEGCLSDLISAIESAAKGEMICSAHVAAVLMHQVSLLASDLKGHPPGDRLTSRETEVVALIERGLTNREIARRLFIEISTVKNHVHNILEKLQVQHRWEAVAWARSQTHFGRSVGEGDSRNLSS